MATLADILAVSAGITDNIGSSDVILGDVVVDPDRSSSVIISDITATGVAVQINVFYLSAESVAGASALGLAVLDHFIVATTSASFVTTAQAPTIFFDVVTSSVAASGGATATRLIDAVVTATTVVNGVVVGQATYNVTAVSMASIISGIQFLQDFWDGWAVNLNTGAPSFYENFKFNSFARIGKNYYGCSDAGVYLLGGDLDGAAQINATVTTGSSDLSDDRFDGSRVKHVRHAYVDARSVEPLVFVCRVEGSEFSYTFDTQKDTVASTRVSVGRGLRGTLWQFELQNTNGADFELESMSVLVEPTSRKI